MAVRMKNRRKIIYNGELYVWYVSPDEDYMDRPVLHIISSDKKLILAYDITGSIPYVISKGRVFQGKRSDGCWSRYMAPELEKAAVTPAFVACLIEWAVNGHNAKQLVWDGNIFYI